MKSNVMFSILLCSFLATAFTAHSALAQGNKRSAETSSDYGTDEITASAPEAKNENTEVPVPKMKIRAEAGGYGNTDGQGGGISLAGSVEKRYLIKTSSQKGTEFLNARGLTYGTLLSPNIAARVNINVDKPQIDRLSLDASKLIHARYMQFNTSAIDCEGCPASKVSVSGDVSVGTLGAQIKTNTLTKTTEVAPTLGLAGASAHIAHTIGFGNGKNSFKLGLEGTSSVQLANFGLGYFYNNGASGFGSFQPGRFSLGAKIHLNDALTISNDLQVAANASHAAGNSGTPVFNRLGLEKKIGDVPVGIYWDHVREEATKNLPDGRDEKGNPVRQTLEKNVVSNFFTVQANLDFLGGYKTKKKIVMPPSRPDDLSREPAYDRGQEDSESNRPKQMDRPKDPASDYLPGAENQGIDPDTARQIK